MQQRQTLIKRFVREYNEGEVHRWEQSVQYQMHRIKEDISRLEMMLTSLIKVYEVDKELEKCTRLFIRTDALNNIDVNRVFLKLKKYQYTRLQYVEKIGAPLEKEKIKSLFEEHIEEFKLAYKAKEATLVCMRKQAKLELLAMFEVYLLLSQQQQQKQHLHSIFRYYMRLIFSDVVMINDHLIVVTLDTLQLRLGQGYRNLGALDVQK